jgi:hypothetical protein
VAKSEFDNPSPMPEPFHPSTSRFGDGKKLKDGSLLKLKDGFILMNQATGNQRQANQSGRLQNPRLRLH